MQYNATAAIDRLWYRNGDRQLKINSDCCVWKLKAGLGALTTARPASWWGRIAVFFTFSAAEAFNFGY